MEFGMVGLEGFSSLPSSDHGKQKCCGSAGFLKHDRPVIVSHDDNDDSRASKIAKVRDDLASKTSSFVFSDDTHQEHNMLSFSSSPKLEDFSLKFNAAVETKNLHKSPFPTYFQYPTSPYSKISGYSCTGGGVNASMYLLNGGGKGAFTPAQWIELEQQALIYKYIVANEPIPPNLLLPIRRALESAGFFSFPGGILRPTSFGYGWGPFHLGFANSTDPEPGRCRRTDGKKWRCSREAVQEQKYCERHMNRGRHRSRKPVEGRAPTKLTNTSPSLVSGSTDASNSFASDHPTSSLGLMLNKQNSSQGISFAESSSQIGFGLLTSDNLYNPNNSLEPEPRHSARPFMNNFMSSTSSPTPERVIHSPLRLSGELEMGLGVGSDNTHHHTKQSSWVPISWETSMGGPLGEALKATSNSPENVSSALNLLSRGWEGNSPQLTASSSPTGVLQRTPLGSLSSSAGSSPRADHGRAPESSGM